jgi:8-oxo-dGTP diphosphatase
MTAQFPDSAGIPGRPVVPCVGAVVRDGQDRLLLIKRGHEPGAGLWSLPGGRVEPGESDAQAVQREVLEETGLTVICGRLVGAVQRPGLAGAVFDIRDYAATRTGGILRPGDDAADVRWASPAEIASLDSGGLLTDGLLGSLRSWGVLA